MCKQRLNILSRRGWPLTQWLHMQQMLISSRSSRFGRRLERPNDFDYVIVCRDAIDKKIINTQPVYRSFDLQVGRDGWTGVREV